MIKKHRLTGTLRDVVYCIKRSIFLGPSRFYHISDVYLKSILICVLMLISGKVRLRKCQGEPAGLEIGLRRVLTARRG